MSAMRTAYSLFIALLAGCLFAGCNLLGFSDSSNSESPFPPPVDVTFTTEALTYETNEDVALVLQNESGQPVQYNLCFSTLQRRTNGTWTDADVSGIACTAELRQMPSGQTARFSYPLSLLDTPPEPGTYRLQTDVFLVDEDGDEREVILQTPAFSLVAP